MLPNSDYAGLRILDVSQGFAGPYSGAPHTRLPASAALGEHTGEILQELNYPTDEIQRLVRTAVVVDGKRKQ